MSPVPATRPVTDVPAPADSTGSPKLELALLGLLAALWGSSYLLIKLALVALPPLTLLAWGQQYVDSGLAGVLNSTSPIFVFLITALITRHEAMNGRELAGALTGLAGVILIIGIDVLGGLGRHLPGQAAVLLSAMLYAGAAIHGKRLSMLTPTATAAGTMLWAVNVLVPLCLVVDRPWTLRPSASSIGAAIVLGLACTGVALLLYFRLLRTLGSLGVASQSYLRSGFSVLLGVLVLGEQLTLAIGLGLAAVIVGVALIHRPIRHRSAARAP